MMARRTAKRKRLRLGDVLELRSTHGLAYLHALGKHPSLGHAIYVYPGWHESRPKPLESLQNLSGYVTFYPTQAAVTQELIDIIGTLPPPIEQDSLVMLRRHGVITREGKTLTWVIERDGKETLKHELDDEDRKLPIASIWNHEFLINRITDNWRPEQEG